MKSIIYYTDNTITEPIKSEVISHILRADLPVFSASLEPINFGDNVVIHEKRCYTTLVKQIVSCLERSNTKYAFFAEHDVLYPLSHFDFIPTRDDVFYYNSNVWRWWFGSLYAVRYDRMLPLSCMCANREFALNHYQLRLKTILDNGWDKIDSKEPRWVRKMGYEPGTKTIKRGGITDDNFDTWQSNQPVIDIRHKDTFSSPKISINSFIHKPTNWQEIQVSDIKSWNLKELFNL